MRPGDDITVSVDANTPQLTCENGRVLVFISRKFLFVVVLLSAVPGGNECGDKEKVDVVEDGDARHFPLRWWVRATKRQAARVVR